MDWGALWDQGTAQVENAFNDLVKTGAPALQASAEQWAINVLTEQNKNTQATLNNNVKELLAQPGTPTSVGTAVAQSVQKAAFANYGLYIVGGIIVVLLIGASLKKG